MRPPVPTGRSAPGRYAKGIHMKSPWQYDETVQVGVDYSSQEEVRAYDERMQSLRDVIKEAEEIGQALSLSPDAVVWEIGTGTGECALAIARRCRRVYATDVSRAMLEYARGKAKDRGIVNVAFEIGGFLSGFQPETMVDAVVSQLALHHLPDFWKSRALGVISGNLRKQGRLYLKDVVFPSDTVDYDRFFENVVESVRAKAGDEVARETIQHIRTEFSTLDWILEGMITRNGLRIIRKDRLGFLTAYVCEK